MRAHQRASVATGYHNMIRWNLFGMLQHPRIRDLQYYARMDTDSRFTEPVRAGLGLPSDNIFSEQKSRNRRY